MRSFKDLLEEAVAFHGHLCSGQVLGIRMAMIGCQEIGIDEPKEGKRLLIYVEIDRCLTDALQSATGCTLGKRTMKFFDYGKPAATFVNLETGKAVRVAVRKESRNLPSLYAPGVLDLREAQVKAYSVAPAAALFQVETVWVKFSEDELKRGRKECGRCGEEVNSGREVRTNGLTLCHPCAYGGYYTKGEPDGTGRIRAEPGFSRWMAAWDFKPFEGRIRR